MIRPARRGDVLVLLAVALALPVAARDLRLVNAAKNQQPELVRSLLKERVGANEAAVDGATALHWASHWNDLDSADALIQAGANVNAATDLGVTPLALACIEGSAPMVDKLLSAGAKAGVKLTSGETALMTCARSGSVQAVKQLIAHGADVNAAENSHGQTALMWAVSERHPEVVAVLIEHGADVHARSRVTPEFVLRRLLSKRQNTGVWIDHGGNTPLLLAARGDAASARLLLAAGADPNETSPDGYSALLAAAHSGQRDVADVLLEHGADPNACGIGFTALHAAVLMGDLALVKALLAHHANPNAPLTNGAPLRRVDSDPPLPADFAGATPFLLAAKFVEVDIMRALLAAGAEPSTGMKNGTTPLMAAAGLEWPGGVDRRGSNLIAAPSPDEDRTLEAARIAIDLGADVTASNKAGDTALHGAASKGYSRVIQLLVDKGAKLDAKNNAGLTPLALTRTTKSSYGQVSLKSAADLLRKLGATE